MTAPVLGAVGLAGTLFSGMKSVQGAEMAGEAQAGMYQYQAGLAEINADIAKQNAGYTRTVGELNAMRYGMQAGQRKGAIIANQAASGLDIRSGSNKDVQDSQDVVTGMDLNMIRSNAMKTAYDYDVQSDQFKNQAELYRMGGENAKAAAKINVQSSILGTATSVASKWLQASQLNLFGIK